MSLIPYQLACWLEASKLLAARQIQATTHGSWLVQGVPSVCSNQKTDPNQYGSVHSKYAEVRRHDATFVAEKADIQTAYRLNVGNLRETSHLAEPTPAAAKADYVDTPIMWSAQRRLPAGTGLDGLCRH